MLGFVSPRSLSLTRFVADCIASDALSTMLDGACSLCFFWRKPSLLIGKGERGPLSQSHTHTHTHAAPHTRTPAAPLGRKETRGWDSPKEEEQTRMGG